MKPWERQYQPQKPWERQFSGTPAPEPAPEPAGFIDRAKSVARDAVGAIATGIEVKNDLELQGKGKLTETLGMITEGVERGADQFTRPIEAAVNTYDELFSPSALRSPEIQARIDQLQAEGVGFPVDRWKALPQAEREALLADLPEAARTRLGNDMLAAVGKRYGMEMNAPFDPSQVTEGLKGGGQMLMEGISPAGQAAMKNTEPSGDITSPSTWSLGKDPSLRGAMMHGAGVAGQMVPIAAAAYLSRGRSLATSSVLGAAQTGGAAGADEQQRIMQMPDEQLAAIPEFAKLVESGMSWDDARAKVADDAGRGAFQLAAPVGALSGVLLEGVGSKAGANVLAKVFGASLPARTLGAGIVESTGEGFQEVAEGVAQRGGAAMATGEDRNLTDGTFGELVMGTLAGPVGAAGAALESPDQARPGAASDTLGDVGQDSPARPPRPEPIEPVTEPPQYGMPRPPATFDETGAEIIPPAGELVPAGPSPAGKEIGPAGPLESAPQPDFVVDQKGQASAPWQYKWRAEDRAAQSGGPGMGPEVTGSTMTDADIAQAAFDSAVEAIRTDTGKAPSLQAKVKIAKSVAQRFGVVEADLLAAANRKATKPAKPTAEQSSVVPVAQPVPGETGVPAAPAASTTEVTNEEAKPVEAKPVEATDQAGGQTGLLTPSPQSDGPRIPRHRKRTPADFEPLHDDLLDFAALNGGLDRAAWEREGVDPAMWKTRKAQQANQRFGPGSPVLFRKNGGMTPAQLREAMEQNGFLNQPGMDEQASNTDQGVIDMVMSAVNQGKRYTTIAATDFAAANAATAKVEEQFQREQATANELRMSLGGMYEELDRAEYVRELRKNRVIPLQSEREAMSLAQLYDAILENGGTEQQITDIMVEHPTNERAAPLWKLLTELENSNGTGRQAAGPRPANGPEAPAGRGQAGQAEASAASAVTGAGQEVKADRRTDGQKRASVDALPADKRDAEIAALRAANEELQRKLDTDGLTGVKSREAYRRDVESAGGVAFVDVIAFKGYNTKFTEAGGDKILQAIGAAMLEVDPNAAYRRGGDEFAFLADSPEVARALAEKMQKALSGVIVPITDANGATYEVRGIPIRYGIGKSDADATADSARRKAEGDRESNPNVVRISENARVERSEEPAGAAGSRGNSPSVTQPELFAGPSQSDKIKAAREAADAKRNGLGRDEVRPESGPGDLLAGPRPLQTDLDTAANQAATSPNNDLPQPTEAQKEAGNYQKGHVRINGLDITIENPRGSQRRPEWPPLADHYGYFKRTEGKDGDQVDVFIGANAEDASLPVFVVNQVTKGGKFDEHKVIMGYPDEASARAAYLANYTPGWTGLDSIAQFTLDQFKDWLANADLSKKAKSPDAVPSSGSGNTIFTDDMAAAARERLRSKLGRSSAGVDPEMLLDGLTLAGWHIEKGARSFAAFAKAMIADLGEASRPYLKSWYAAVRMDPRASGFDGMDSLAVVESADIDAVGGDNAPSPNGSVEPSSGNGNGGAPAVEATVRAEPAGAATGTRINRKRPVETGVQPSGDQGVPALRPTAAGSRGNFDLFAGPRSAGAEASATGSDDGIGSRGLGDGGIQAERKGTGRAPRITGDTRPELTARAQQARAGVEVKLGDAANIAETLPYLLPGQQEDVLKAENRFANPDGYGMLFTNGTGTGKTFTGLGIVKRFALQGKLNTLIIGPTDKVLQDWMESGKRLGLSISQLSGTKDSGSGIVATTFANFGANDTLADRNWDLVVVDEAHYLSQNEAGQATLASSALNAIALHPSGYFRRAYMLHRDLFAKIGEQQAIEGKTGEPSEKLKALYRERERLTDQVKEYVMARQGASRPRVTFLSATPFAYVKSIDWADGYLFDYNEGQDPNNSGLSYNSGDNRERFFMQHFGFRMRFNKLTQPEAGVDHALMERQFNTWLRNRGVLSSRLLDVVSDYDRKFVLVESAIGQQIDRALEWLWENSSGEGNDGMRRLSEAIRKRFDHLSRRYLLEAIKAKESIPLIREHLALGRKVVVFHDYKKGGGFNPFVLSPEDSFAADYERFKSEFRGLVNFPFSRMPAPLEAFKAAFPDLLTFNGDMSKTERRAAVAKFNDDATGPVVILVQSAAGKEGISLHDTTGKYQRVQYNLGLPTQPTTAIQQEGRIYRVGQASNALFRYLNTGTNWERWAFAQTIAARASTAENLAIGEQARALRDAFITGFEESDNYRAGDEGEGTGGKERDKAANAALSEFDRARSFYFGTQKKNSRTKSAEGDDYFATPEPLGLKMVEWADIRPGEDVLEPSGGHGAIARWFPGTGKSTVVEKSETLASRLAMVADPVKTRLVIGQFESLDLVNKYDAIVMNPPFGTAGRLAVDHLAKAARHLRDGGRIVALLPDGPGANAKFDKWFYETESRPLKPVLTHPTLGPIYKGDRVKSRASWAPEGTVVSGESPTALMVSVADQRAPTMITSASITEVSPTGKRTEEFRPAEGLYLVATIKLPNITFERAGTGQPVRIVVIDKGDSRGEVGRDFSSAETINEFFDRIENSSIPPRMKPVQEVEPEPAPAVREAPRAAKAAEKAQATQEGAKLAEQAGEPVVEHVTGKGKTLRGVIRKITQDEAKALDPYTFRKNGGFFIRLDRLKGDGLAANPEGWESTGGVETIPEDVMQAEVAKARAAFGPGITIEVLDSIQDAPVSEDSKRRYPGAQGSTNGRDRVWIFRNFQTVEALRMTLAHEVIGHIGVEAVIGDDWPSVQATIERIRSGDMFVPSAIKNAVDSAVRRYPGANPLLLAREAVAIMAERGVTGSLWDQIVSAVRRWLRNTFKTLAWSDAEIRDLLRRAGERVRKAGVYWDGDFRAFDESMASNPDDTIEVDGVERSRTNSNGDPSTLASNPPQGPVTAQMAKDARAGQPIDKIFRAPFSALGLLDSHGRLRWGRDLTSAEQMATVGGGIAGGTVAGPLGILPGAAIGLGMSRLLNFLEARIDPEGRFGWMASSLEAARHGFIDRYGTPADFTARDDLRQSEIRAVLMRAATIAQQLEGLSTAEAEVLQAMLTGQQIKEGDLGKLAQPIQEAIDQMGREAVELGLISAEAYEKNRGAYLHRSYFKYEQQRTPLGRFFGNLMDRRRKKIMGDALRSRGMSMERDAETIAQALGGSLSEGDIVTVMRQKTQTGGVKTRYQRGPLIGSPPVGWENLGDWRVMKALGKKAVLWRDYTPEERIKMGEILDARYNIVKTFTLMANDLANGKFLRDIAANPDWAVKDMPPGASVAEAGGRYSSFSSSDWIRVPDTVIPGTNDGTGNTVKRWGALAGMYLRAPIYRDLMQLQEMQSPSVFEKHWSQIMSIWKTNKTARNPVVHMNNVMSNLVFMDLADVRARDLVDGIRSVAQGEANEQYRDAMAHGAFGGLFLEKELRDRVLQPILEDIERKAIGDSMDNQISLVSMLARGLWNGVKKLDNKMIDFYRIEDEVFRMAFYTRRLALGDTKEEAASAARRQFIDYDIRAPWVNAARNTVLPFIGYTYRAVPLLAEAIAHRPWKLAKYYTLAALANFLGYMFAPGDEEDEREVMPEQLQGMTWLMSPRMIRMPWKDEHGAPVFLDVRRWIPAGDIFDNNQSEIGVPAVIQFGGPLQMAFELMMNKQSFTQKPIVQPLTDTAGEKAAKVAEYTYKAFAPNAPWIPESYSWDKIGNAMTGQTDSIGRDLDTPMAIASVLGVKLQAMDQNVQRLYRSYDFDRAERELDFEESRLKREFKKKALDQDDFNEQIGRINEKRRNLAMERRKVLGKSE